MMKKYIDYITERKITYQKQLCPDIWEDKVLNKRIEDKLLRIARDFFEEIEFDTEIVDITFVGSLANYNYTTDSDIDVHIKIDFSDVNNDIILVKTAVDGKRFIWNLKHNIVIKGHDVELYIQDINEEHISAGSYSLLNRKWIKFPTYNPPDVENEDIDVKYDARVYDIEELKKFSDQKLDPIDAEAYYKKAKELLNKIMKARKAGLSESGEFSIENLVFKKLRKEGEIEKLINSTNNLYDKIYSQ